MNILACYDVDTTTKEGRRRLNRVAKACEAFGRRVQDSVFECRLTVRELNKMRRRLLKIVDAEEDSLRIYRLPSGERLCTEAYGKSLLIDSSVL